MSPVDTDLVQFVLARTAMYVEMGKATVDVREAGGHVEVVIQPASATACPVTVVGLVPTDVTLSVGDPPVTLELWARQEAEGKDVLGSYLDAIFAGRIVETVWAREGRVTKGRIELRLADGSRAKHRYSHQPLRRGSRTHRTFDPY